MENTAEKVSRLKFILEKIREEEDRAIEFCRKLNTLLQDIAKENELPEYYIDCSVMVFNFDDAFCEKFKTTKGFPYYTEDHCPISWDDEKSRNENLIDMFFRPGEELPLQDLHCCWTAFFLKAGLSLDDFMAMEKITIEVIVNFYPLDDFNTIETKKWQQNKE